VPPEIINVITRQRNAILRSDETVLREMTRQWLQVERNLAGLLDALTQELAAMTEPVPFWKLAQMERYQALMTQVDVQMVKYANYAGNTIARQQSLLTGMAVEHSAESVSAVAGRVSVGFNKLPVTAVENMIGLTGDGSPLRAILTDASRAGPQALGDALVRGVALGYNPRKMAAMALREGLAKSLTRMETIARTEALRSYREASRTNYLNNSDVISGYKRMCAKSTRTCVSCLALDGQEYPLSVPFEEHVNGRCTAVPILRYSKPPTWQSGREWFEQQPETTQVTMMGPTRHQLWKDGKVSWSDLASTEHNPVWGNSPKVTPVRDLVAMAGE
jgi:hypothetical protein